MGADERWLAMAATAPPKLHVSPQELLEWSFELAAAVFESGYRPTWMIGIWRGGAPPGLCVHEYLEAHGCKPDHISVRTSSYQGIGEQAAIVRVHGLEYFVETANADDRLLIVDDIFDSGRSVEALIAKIRRKMRANTPGEIRIATVFYKPENNRTVIRPDYYRHTTIAWVVFPHELEALTADEIARYKGPRIAALMQQSGGAGPPSQIDPARRATE